jgi:hypothetical protein
VPPQSGALSHCGLRLSGVTAVPSTCIVKTSAAPPTPLVPKVIDVPSGENDDE